MRSTSRSRSWDHCCSASSIARRIRSIRTAVCREGREGKHAGRPPWPLLPLRTRHHLRDSYLMDDRLETLLSLRVAPALLLRPDLVRTCHGLPNASLDDGLGDAGPRLDHARLQPRQAVSRGRQRLAQTAVLLLHERHLLGERGRSLLGLVAAPPLRLRLAQAGQLRGGDPVVRRPLQETDRVGTSVLTGPEGFPEPRARAEGEGSTSSSNRLARLARPRLRPWVQPGGAHEASHTSVPPSGGPTPRASRRRGLGA